MMYQFNIAGWNDPRPTRPNFPKLWLRCHQGFFVSLLLVSLFDEFRTRFSTVFIPLHGGSVDHGRHTARISLSWDPLHIQTSLVQSPVRAWGWGCRIWIIYRDSTGWNLGVVLPSGYVKIAIENGPFIVDLPIDSMVDLSIVFC